MLHALRHRRFVCITWVVLLLALMQPALGRAAYLHALHRAAHTYGQPMRAAPLAAAGVESGACDTAAYDTAHGRHGTADTDAVPASVTDVDPPDARHGHQDAARTVAPEASASASDGPHGDCDCRDCPVLASHVLACCPGPWQPAEVATASPGAVNATPPRVYRAHPCGLGSRGPPAAI